MKFIRVFCCAVLICAAALYGKVAAAQTSAPAASDPQAIWNALAKPRSIREK
jgi:hypothetical protein